MPKRKLLPKEMYERYSDGVNDLFLELGNLARQKDIKKNGPNKKLTQRSTHNVKLTMNEILLTVRQVLTFPPKTVTVYACGTAWKDEVDETDITVYPSAASCKHSQGCSGECGLVELTMMANRWIIPQKPTSQWKRYKLKKRPK